MVIGDNGPVVSNLQVVALCRIRTLGRDSFNIKVSKGDNDAFVRSSIETILALSVARVETRIVGGCEAAVRSPLTSVDEATIDCGILSPGLYSIICNEGVVGLEASGTGFGSADKCDEHLVCAAHEPWWNLTAAVDADDAVLPEMLLHCTHCHRIYIVATVRFTGVTGQVAEFDGGENKLDPLPRFALESKPTHYVTRVRMREGRRRYDSGLVAAAANLSITTQTP